MSDPNQPKAGTTPGDARRHETLLRRINDEISEWLANHDERDEPDAGHPETRDYEPVGNEHEDNLTRHRRASKAKHG